MQVFFCEVLRARTKFGMAIAANRPMMATTIMISTSVKPDLRDVLMFMTFLFLCVCGANTLRWAGYYYYNLVFA